MKPVASFTISYLILVHKNPEQVLRLINRLDDACIFFYLHVDKNTDINPFIKTLGNRNNIFFICEQDRIACKWGDISLVYATIALMKAVLQDNRQGMMVYLSGQDYPLKNKVEIKQFLFDHQTINFLGSEKLPVARWQQGGFSRFENYNFVIRDNGVKLVMMPTLWTLHRSFYKKTFHRLFKNRILLKENYKLFFKKRKLPDNLVPHGNSQWWALPASTVRFLITYLDSHPKILHFFSYCMYADELIFHTIFSSKKELLTYQEDRPILTFIDWNQPVKGNPAIFSEEDFLLLKNTPHLFARKFDMKKNTKILDMIDEAVDSGL